VDTTWDGDAPVAGMQAGNCRAPLGSVDITAELSSRNSRHPDHAAENRAFAALMEELANPAGNVLQELAAAALRLCGAHSAGISILEEECGRKVFRWRAVAGQWSGFLGGTMPREISPCGTVLDQNREMLLSRPERHFPIPPEVSPPIAEVLLVPFRLAGRPVGTLWVIAHDKSRQFDGEDQRLMNSLARFASLAYRQAGTLEALRNSERRFRDMIDALPAAIYTTDATGRLTHCNPAAVELAGRSPEFGTDQWCVSWKLYRPDGTPLPHDQCPMAVVLKEGRAVTGEEIIVERPDGTRASVVPYPTPLRDAEGTIIGGINMLIDVTDRKQAEETRARLAAIVESSDDAVVGKTLDGIITSWNGAAEKMFGYTATEAVGQHISLIIPAERREEEDEVLARLRNGQKIDHFETERQAKDGRRINISLTVSPIRSPAGKIIGASKVARDITERKRTEKALQEADRRKTEFLATLAHELRNPLAPIRNSLHILRMGDDAPAVERVHEMLERQVNHLVRLVDDLLEISRITSGKIELRTEPVEIAAAIRTAVETSKPLIEAGGHQLAITLPAQPLTVEADPLRLSQIIANLLNNAAKYTDPGGQLWLTATREGGEVAISVRDTGIGLSADMLASVFEMFMQVDGNHKRSQGGLGIGLSLVKRLVELHGGRVEAKSAGVGRGSEFKIRLPLAKKQLPVVKAKVTKSPNPRPAQRQRILVVDDNKDAAMTLGMLLKMLGQEICTAHDGAGALAAIESHRPSLVLLDLGMPGMSGFEVAQRVRAVPQFAHVALVALTGWGQEEDRQRTRAAGFDDHLVKPVDLAALSALLARMDSRSCEPANDSPPPESAQAVQA
jgi:PAS domain S-box-containing protein